MDHNNSTESSMTEVEIEMNFDDKLADHNFVSMNYIFKMIFNIFLVNLNLNQQSDHL